MVKVLRDFLDETEMERQYKHTRHYTDLLI